MWECGCILAVWECGCVLAVWERRYVFGCVGVRVFGCAGVFWLCGRAGVLCLVWMCFVLCLCTGVLTVIVWGAGGGGIFGGA